MSVNKMSKFYTSSSPHQENSTIQLQIWKIVERIINCSVFEIRLDRYPDLPWTSNVKIAVVDKPSCHNLGKLSHVTVETFVRLFNQD